jgi:DNA-nicking Smr family endonuclease|tara:strand:+ start:70 stop:507 length:438 start_codon:yes stop_codon:yes gene_type:complete
VKKKHVVSSKDKKDWIDFTKQISNISPKEADFLQNNTEINKVRKLDLHGFSLSESNKIVKKFVVESFDQGYKKLLIVTGKGLRSKSYDNPYISEKFSVLRYAVPEYINNDESLNNKVRKISIADIKNGGEGAIYIFLKSNKKFTK